MNFRPARFYNAAADGRDAPIEALDRPIYSR